MGICVSSPGNISFTSKKKISNLSSDEYDEYDEFDEYDDYDTVRKSFSFFVRSVTILKEPNGDNIFKRYNLGKELGRGEFGITYQCTDIITGESLACKSISKARLRTQTDIEDVRREVEIMRHLPKHPNIVRLKEVYEDAQDVHLVMEICQGGELFDRIVARGRYTERAAAVITKTIVEVIKLCHKHGVMHRDLKPENFLFSDKKEDSPLKTIDFGLSVFFKPGQRFKEIVGSPFYMAPEVLKRNYGPEVDIWSAGVILYILLCGVPPYWAATEEGIAQAIVRGGIDFERDPWPKISDDAKDLVRNMLDPNPYNRLTAQEVLDHPWLQNANKASDVTLGENVRSRIKQFSLMNKFKKRVIRVLANNLPLEQVAGIKKMFQMMDTDNNGNLTFEELKHGLYLIGQPVPDQDVQLFLDAADMDKNGTVSSNEFITVTVHLKRMGSDDQLCQAFSYFDKNGNGFIEFEELREALLDDDLGPVDEQVIQDIIGDVDTNKDGKISYEEFKTMMTTGMDWRMASRQYSRAMLNAISFKLFKDTSVQVKKL